MVWVTEPIKQIKVQQYRRNKFIKNVIAATVDWCGCKTLVELLPKKTAGT